MEIYKDLNTQANKDFENLLNSQLSKIKIEEEKDNKRNVSAEAFKSMLSDFQVTSIKELEKFQERLSNEITELEKSTVNNSDEEENDNSTVSDIPAIGSASKLPTWRPDPNTNYLCRSPNENGQPCPEGMFCDGTTQSCIPNYVGGSVPSVGYFS